MYMEILNICAINFINNTIWCVPEKPCCASSNKKSIWDSFYAWLAFGLIFFLLITSVIIYLANACKKKQQNLIRIRNLSEILDEPSVLSTTTGPGGIIQPDIKRFNNSLKCDSATIDVSDVSIGNDEIKPYAKPLSPPYPPVKPITIIKGLASTEGYRQTEAYTDVVLPPGFIDCDHYKPQ